MMVAEGVVDLLEAVQVQDQQREGRVIGPGRRDPSVDLPDQEGPVGHPGQRVVGGLVGQPLLGPLPLGDVDAGAGHVERLAPVVEEGLAPIVQPADAPVGPDDAEFHRGSRAPSLLAPLAATNAPPGDPRGGSGPGTGRASGRRRRGGGRRAASTARPTRGPRFGMSQRNVPVPEADRAATERPWSAQLRLDPLPLGDVGVHAHPLAERAVVVQERDGADGHVAILAVASTQPVLHLVSGPALDGERPDAGGIRSVLGVDGFQPAPSRSTARRIGR